MRYPRHLIRRFSLCLAAALVLVEAATAAISSCPRANIKISEVSYAPAAGQPQWVELINTSPAEVDVRGMELVSGANAYSLPTILPPMPSNGFVVVYFDAGSAGSNDLSFAGDNLVVLHASPTNALGNPSGTLALYQVTGVRTRDTIVDFVAWGAEPGEAARLAVDKGLWSSTSTFLPTQRDGAVSPKGPFVPMAVGGALTLVGGVWVTYEQSDVTPGGPNRRVVAPHLTDPSEGEWSEETPGWFRWVGQPGADHFQLQVAADRDFVNIIWNLTNVVGNTYLPGTNALPVGTHWCRVRAFASDGTTSSWSVVVSLRVGNPVVTPPESDGSSSKAPDPPIQGRVLDARTGNGLANVAVSLRIGGTVLDATTTDGFGRFTLNGTNGAYTIVSVLTNYTIPALPVNVTGAVAGLVINGMGDSGSLPTPLVALGAKKDTPLLQVKNFGGMMCEKTATARDQAWDQPHNQYHPNAGELESWYCWAIMATMIARHNGGTLYIDEVVNQVKSLGFEKAAAATDPEATQALQFALQTGAASLNYTRTKFTEAQVRTAITNDQPIAYSTPVHWMVIDAFRYEDGKMKCRFVNENNTANARWLDYAAGKAWDSGFIPNKGLSGRAANAKIGSGAAWVDADGDGVLDFDEDTRFNANKAKTDTDDDGIPDKLEISSWAFPRDGVGGNIAGKEFAPAWGMKAQYTADTDDGGIKDGDEDKNHDSLSGKWDTANPGETDVFDKRDDGMLDLVFCIDLTGSMWDDIDQVKVNAVNIINNITNKFRNYRIAVTAYKDHPISPYGDPGDYPFRVFAAFTTNADTVISAINALSVGGGNDWPESVYSGLIGALNGAAIGGWRPNPVKRAIILMGDAPPHDPEPVTGYTFLTVVGRAISGGVLIEVGGSPVHRPKEAPELSGPISIFSLLIGSDSSARDSFRHLSEDTGGTLVETAGASGVPAQIVALLEDIKLSTTAILNVRGPGGESNVRGLTNIVADGSGSLDPEACGILKYEWDWDGDGAYDETSFDPIVSHDYPGGFTGPLKLRVTTLGGATAVATFSLPPLVAGGLEILSQTINTNIDRQTGLFYQEVVVTNTGSAGVDGLRVHVTGLATNVALVGATGTNGGVPFVEFHGALAGNSAITLVLAYYAAGRQPPAGLSLEVESITPAPPPPPAGTTLTIRRAFLRPDGKMAVEFDSTAGQHYAIQYSGDLTTWKTVQPPLRAFGNRFLWVDVGPPQTESPPTTNRFYRVIHVAD